MSLENFSLPLYQHSNYLNSEFGQLYLYDEPKFGNTQSLVCRSLKNLWDENTASNPLCQGNTCSFTEDLIVTFLEKEKACTLNLNIDDEFATFEYESDDNSEILSMKNGHGNYLKSRFSESGDLSINWGVDNGVTTPSTGGFSLLKNSDGTTSLNFANGDVTVSGVCTTGKNQLKCSFTEEKMSLFSRSLEVEFKKIEGENPFLNHYVMDFKGTSSIPLLPSKDLGKVEAIIDEQTGSYIIKGYLKDPAGNVLFNSTIKNDVKDDIRIDPENLKIVGGYSSATEARIFFMTPNVLRYDLEFTRSGKLDESLTLTSEAHSTGKLEFFRPDEDETNIEIKVDIKDVLDPTKENSISERNFIMKQDIKREHVIGIIHRDLEIDYLSSSQKDEVSVDYQSEDGVPFHSLTAKATRTESEGNDRYHFSAETDDSITELSHTTKK